MYQFTKTFPEKRAFITGTASGLGRAFSELLAKDGWTIGMSDINQKGLAETAQLVEKAGGTAYTYKFDVADKQQYAQVAEQFLAQTGGIDLLINNAGVGDGDFFEEYSLENWEWMIGINQMGVIYGCHLFLPHFKKQQSGHIMNIASAAAFANPPRMSTYNVTKAAVLAIANTLHTELIDDNISVSVVMPTFIRTNIMQFARGGEDDQKMGRKLIADSNLEAIDMADRFLKAAGAGKLHIVEPFTAKILYLMDRFFPKLFMKFKINQYRANQKLAKKL